MPFFTPPLRFRHFLSGLCVMAASVTPCRIVHADPALLETPTAPIVQEGSAGFTGLGTAGLTVTQTSTRALIDWQSFNIGQNAEVIFNQQNGTGSIAINRVTGAGIDPTQIMGKLTANGTVIILDGNGVVFGAGAVLDVGGIVAATGHLANPADFINGQPFQLENTDAQKADAAIINNSTNITVRSAGLAAFVAPMVQNNGIITAHLGTITLASGTHATLDFYGDRLLNLTVDAGLTQALGAGKTQIENKGQLRANGGTVQLTARAAAGVADQAINTTGIISAQYASLRNGKIILSASPVDHTEFDNTLLTGPDARLQDAIDMANADGSTTVHVLPGTYHESITIDRAVHLTGGGVSLPTLAGDGSAPNITVAADDVTIENLFITGGLHGIYTDRSARLRILYNQFFGAVENAIHLAHTRAAEITGNLILNAGQHGIYLFDNQQATLSQNFVLSSTGYNLFLHNSADSFDDGSNFFVGAASGIEVFSQEDPTPAQTTPLNDSPLFLRNIVPQRALQKSVVITVEDNHISTPADLAAIAPAAGEGTHPLQKQNCNQSLGEALQHGGSSSVQWDETPASLIVARLSCQGAG
jgi:filamentous hemagglutinin family protein